MKIDKITYTPLGNGLGYCLGVHQETGEQTIFYFRGYPKLPYEQCEILPIKEADIKTFVSNTIMGEGRDKNQKYFKGKIVKKGLGKMLSQDWQFIPDKGIQCDDVEIFFGMDRWEIRIKLNNEHEFNYSRFETEDSYQEYQNSGTWFRLGYNDNNLLQEIEFLEGRLSMSKIIILGSRQSLQSILKNFSKEGFSFYKLEYDNGWLCEALKCTLASAQEMGGDSDECSYFYVSADISHLLENPN